jgi:hypothetical protein
MRHGTLWDSETPAESEICYFANSVLVHQDILWFKISVKNTALVKIFHTLQDLEQQRLQNFKKLWKIMEND